MSTYANHIKILIMEKLFDFESFVSVLRNYPEWKRIIDEYEEYVEPLSEIKSVKGTMFYKKHLSKYYLPKALFECRVHDSPRYEIDGNLLVRLIIGSRVTDYCLTFCNNSDQGSSKWVLFMEILSAYDPYKKHMIEGKLSELSDYQVFQKFLVYVAIQMELAVKWKKDGVWLDDKTKRFIKQFNAAVKNIVNNKSDDCGNPV